MVILKLTNSPVLVEISDEDYDWAIQFNWRLHSEGYAVKGKNNIYLHQEILKRMGIWEKGKICDHIDRDRTNNRRENLRMVTKSQDGINRKIQSNNNSGFRGVYFHKRSGKWLAQIMKDGKRIHLGYFSDQIDAAKAYDKAAIEYHGKYAVLNFN